MVSAWGLLESYLGTLAGGSPRDTATPLTFQDTRLVEVFLKRAARLAAADPRNEPLGEIATPLGLTRAQVKALMAAGVTNLSTLASSILSAREAEGSAKDRTLPPALVAAVFRSIGQSLDGLYGKRRARKE